MRPPCIPFRGFDNGTKEFYVHIKDQIGIKTQQELGRVCCTCDKFIGCTSYLILNTLLANNDAPKTRQGTQGGICS